MTRWVTIVFLALSWCCATAVADDDGMDSPFRFGFGARDLALGGANLPTVDFTTAPVWNASRLAAAERPAISVFHSRLFEADVVYQYVGVVAPTLDFGTLGIGVARLGIDGIDGRDASNVPLGGIGDNRLGLFVGYGRAISGYDFGLAVALEHHSLGDYSATSSPGVNLSLGRRFPLTAGWIRAASIALIGSNVVRPSLNLATESVPYPFHFDGSVSLHLSPDGDGKHAALASANIGTSDRRDPNLALGLEYRFEERLSLRGGYRNGRLTFGAGIDYRAVRVDYAVVDRDLGGIHMFTLTTFFGKSVSEKRRLREERREEEFHTLMGDRLAMRNREMVAGLVADGERLLGNDESEEARNQFDRALFIARSSGLDTSRILALEQAAEARNAERDRLRRVATYIDSARVKMAAMDHVTARYFASLALAEVPSSREATRLLEEADAALDQLASKNEILQHRLLAVDSLLSYGRFNEALMGGRALLQFAPDDPRARAAVRRARFELWRERASSAYSEQDFGRALLALDSASVLFPDHHWCEDMRARVASHRRALEAKPGEVTAEPVNVPSSVVPVSSELRREVSVSYKEGRDAFKAGDLDKAVAHWERVERLIPGYESVRSYLVPAYRLVGIEFYGRSNLDAAVATWRKAAHLDPANEEISAFLERTEAEIRRLRELSYEQQ